MNVRLQKNNDAVETGEFFAAGACLALTVGSDTFRIVLTAHQWKLLAEVAERKARGE